MQSGVVRGFFQAWSSKSNCYELVGGSRALVHRICITARPLSTIRIEIIEADSLQPETKPFADFPVGNLGHGGLIPRGLVAFGKKSKDVNFFSVSNADGNGNPLSGKAQVFVQHFAAFDRVDRWNPFAVANVGDVGSVILYWKSSLLSSSSGRQFRLRFSYLSCPTSAVYTPAFCLLGAVGGATPVRFKFEQTELLSDFRIPPAIIKADGSGEQPESPFSAASLADLLELPASIPSSPGFLAADISHVDLVDLIRKRDASKVAAVMCQLDLDDIAFLQDAIRNRENKRPRIA
eukprot:tig00021293_g20021.t1